MGNDEHILNQLPPIEGETIYSYISRLAAWTGWFCMPMQQLLEYIYGTKRVKTPNYYISDCLDHIVRIIKNDQYECLSSPEALLMNMSVLPFYSYFFSDDKVKSIINELKYDTYNLNSVARKLKIFTLNNQLERDQVIKFCPECIKDTIYLDREHMVIGNYMCYKHNVPLHYIKRDYQGRYATIDNILAIDYSKGEPCIGNNQSFYSLVAILVHSIFADLLKDDIVIMKNKIYSKLCELNIFSYEQLEQIYQVRREWINENIGEKVFYHMLTINKYGMSTFEGNVMPIYYIYMVSILFENYSDYITYQINKFDDVKEKKKIEIPIWNKNQNPKELWQNRLDLKFDNEYTIISEYKNAKEKVVIRHNKCGNESLKYLDNFIKSKGKCRKCCK